MARPPTPIGSWGEIWTKKESSKPPKWRAGASMRMANGESKMVRRWGPTETAAKNRLKEALSQLSDEVKSGEITPQTRMKKIALLWLKEVDREVALGTLGPDTGRIYKSTVHTWVIPKVGELQACEFKTKNCDSVISKAQEKNSISSAKTVRTVLSNISAFGIRHGALEVNPVRSTTRLKRSKDDEKKKEVLSLTVEQRVDLRAKLEVVAEAKQVDKMGRSVGPRGEVWRMLPDIMDGMLATASRVGELLALNGDDIEPAEPTVDLSHHLVRAPGQGLKRLYGRKMGEPALLLLVPQWSVPMWRRRKLASGGGPLFPAARATYLDPSNVSGYLKEALELAGYSWVTSHVFRKTVSTHMDQNGATLTEMADQLGNTPAVVAQHYRARRVSNAGTVALLETMMDLPEAD